MPISVNCLAAALAPWVPGPLNPAPIEKFEDWLQPHRLLAKASASRFNLAASEFELFEKWWDLSAVARGLHAIDDDASADEIKQAFVRLAAIVNDHDEYTEVGYRHVLRMPGTGRFVIFSDHHMGFAGGRQDFFRNSGNSDLYAEILDEYAAAGFTLVENGDVEELVIHEPMMPPPEAALQERAEWRLVQLSQVIANHQALYEQINTQFVEQDRYVRLAGNHDQDNQDARFLEQLRTVYPRLKRVYDFVIMEPVEAGRDAGFVIGHGHHFDKASTPKYADQVGEMLSECLSWAYEGADRVWRWDGTDGVQRWAGGGEPFPNTLVTDDPQPHEMSSEMRAALTEALLSALTPTTLTLAAAIPLVNALVGEVSRPGYWEETFQGNIAWEYFRSEDPGEAVFNEVYCGERWFKFRHLDEIFIDKQLQTRFRTRVPWLVLGHSHEPRHRSWNPKTSVTADRYLNSGSAGRFENLIWGIEILDGIPQVIAWHRPGGPRSAEAPERRTYTPGSDGERGTLTASPEHVPLPLPVDGNTEDTHRPWLTPVLHTMLGSAG